MAAAQDSYLLHRRSTFRGGGAAAPTLAYTNGLFIWHKADRLTELGTNDGQALYVWPDSSGNNFHSYQGTTANRPVYKANVVNGYAVVRFDAPTAQRYFDISNVFLTYKPEALEAFFVLIADLSSPATNRGLYRLTGSSGNVSLYPDTSSKIRDEMGGSGLYNISPAYPITAWHIHHVASFTNVSTGKWNITNWCNDTVGGGATNIYHSAYTSANNIGSGSSSLIYNFFDGDIAEFILYTNIVTESDRIVVLNYLKTKYGIVF